MRVDCALLCDAVTVREGLLHILGGGVTEVIRPSFPSPMGVGLALRILAHPTEVAGEHTLRIDVRDQDGGPVAELQVMFKATEAPKPDEDASIVVPLGLQGVPIPQAGRYSIEILVDNIHQRSVPFNVKEAPPPVAEGPTQ